MFANGVRIGSLMLFALALTAAAPRAGGEGDQPPADDGVMKVRSAYAMSETIDRLKQDIASKGITFFTAIDQSKLATDAGINLRSSTLLVFGNPAVWAAYTDFAWIARRHRIEDRAAAFGKASEVIASITSSVKPK
jgi:hypothetical protein